jgi:hypothetical protein
MPYNLLGPHPKIIAVGYVESEEAAAQVEDVLMLAVVEDP